jgi:hypothetical protein
MARERSLNPNQRTEGADRWSSNPAHFHTLLYTSIDGCTSGQLTALSNSNPKLSYKLRYMLSNPVL